ncbi:hypothetical protein D6T64_08885 [Cryobacterium melibiosiphilum]|uniref:DUF4190 domain-containing protein n=1 Tax=Cryobacterium melibiosiphilum TaxID=995039 RepID=A0A3A5MFJ8_9MICO|nr:hypothetical protein [Cryobacterium melibiosiphilum]RJT88887.1 hypothetical protein D6T64_08885 [Cryobacterium melibiosiphilum]
MNQNAEDQPETPLPAWSAPNAAALPDGGGTNNKIAVSARNLIFWALGTLLGGWIVAIVLTFVADPAVQTLGIIVSWFGGFACIVLAIIAVVFASIGLSRARRLGGLRKGTALAALIAGIVIIIVPLVLLVAIAVLSAQML